MTEVKCILCGGGCPPYSRFRFSVEDMEERKTDVDVHVCGYVKVNEMGEVVEMNDRNGFLCIECLRRIVV